MEPLAGISLIGLSAAQITLEGLRSLPDFLGHKLGEDYLKGFSKSALESVLRRAKEAKPAANHDLPRAIRRSSLLATTILVRQYRQYAIQSMPGSPWVDWCDLLTKWLQEEVLATRRDSYRVRACAADNRFAELVDYGEHPQETFGGELQQAVIADVRREIIDWHHREWAPEHANFPEPSAVFLQWLGEGWPFSEEQKTVGAKVVSFFTRRRGVGPDMQRRSQTAQPAPVPGQTIHWFSLFAAFFNEELKTNNRVHAIFDAKLLTEITDRLKQAGASDLTIDPAKLGQQLGDWLASDLAAWGREFCEKLDELHCLVEESRKGAADQLLELFDRLAVLDAGLEQRGQAVLQGLSRLEVKVHSVKEDTLATRAGVEQLLGAIHQLRQDLATGGRKPSDLSPEELKLELAQSPPDLHAEKLDRLMVYARFNADISRIVNVAPVELIGRENEKRLLSEAWEKVVLNSPDRPSIITLVGLGGEGKTSLVAKWVVDEMCAKGWPNCDAAFAWSFSEGTRAQQDSSSDLFLNAALTFFGVDADRTFAASSAAAGVKGQRLARLVGQRRSLLILDGLEPLQYAPTAPTPGELKDQGLAGLLKGLAAASHGLCIVTTHYSLPDLRAFWQTTSPEVKLRRLSREAGVHLLETLNVKGSKRRDIPVDDDDPDSEKVNECEKLVEDVKGHALTLTLLGSFLYRAFRGVISKRDRVKFKKADEKIAGGNAFRTLAAFEQWLLRDGGEAGQRAVAVLRLMGLFDRPADAGCLNALLQPPAISGLTEPLVGLAEDDWRSCLTDLESANLLTVTGDSVYNRQSAIGNRQSLYAHPHLREYFANQLREQSPEAWRAAHERLYEYLCAATPDKPQPTLEDLQPLFQAVVHGCHSGLHKDVLKDVYFKRICLGQERGDSYVAFKLGAIASDLSLITSFFDHPWLVPNAKLDTKDQAWLISEAGFQLRALGRFDDAHQPTRKGAEMTAKHGNRQEVARRMGNVSVFELSLGNISAAIDAARMAIQFADESQSPYERMARRTNLADAYQHAGDANMARVLFEAAETIAPEHEQRSPQLCMVWGFRYCDFLLAQAEQCAWQQLLFEDGYINRSRSLNLAEVRRRSLQSCEWRKIPGWIYDARNVTDIALDHLTLARVGLYTSILDTEGSLIIDRRLFESKDVFREGGGYAHELDKSIDQFQQAQQKVFLPLGLLTRAWLRFLTGARTGPNSAQVDLDDAWEIAERGPMRLHMADIHLYRARLFGGSVRSAGGPFSVTGDRAYPWESPAKDLAEAERLINQCGYHRRDGELADAKMAILSQ
jgi:hypothetical protein